MQNRLAMPFRSRRATSVLLLCSCAAIVGCQTYYAEHIYGNESSTYFSVPVDSVFRLEKAVTIPENRSRVFFQNGRSMQLGAVDRYSAYCSLDVATRKAVAQTIDPGPFVVRQVRREYRYQLADAAGSIQVAQLDHGGDADYLVVATILELYSAKQPEVSALVCAHWGLPQDRSYISINVIRQVLGGFFDLRWQTAERVTIDPQTVRRKPDQGY